MKMFTQFLEESSYKEQRRKELLHKIESSKLSDDNKKLQRQIAKEHSNIHDIEQHHRDMDNLKEDVQELEEGITYSLHQDADGDHYAKVYHNGKHFANTKYCKSQIEAHVAGKHAIEYYHTEEGKEKIKKHFKESTELEEGYADGWSAKDMSKHLKNHGFVFVRNGGKHDVYHHPKTKEEAAVPRHTGDLATGTAKQLLDKAKRAAQVNESSQSSADYKVNSAGKKYPATRITFKDFSSQDTEHDDEKEDEKLIKKLVKKSALKEDSIIEAVHVKYDKMSDGNHVAYVTAKDKVGNVEECSYSAQDLNKLKAHVKKVHGKHMNESVENLEESPSEYTANVHLSGSGGKMKPGYYLKRGDKFLPDSHHDSSDKALATWRNIGNKTGVKIHKVE